MGKPAIMDPAQGYKEMPLGLLARHYEILTKVEARLTQFESYLATVHGLDYVRNRQYRISGALKRVGDELTRRRVKIR